MSGRLFLYTALGAILLLPALNTKAAELITNGSFENTMTGWTINNATNPWIPWQSVTSGYSNGFLAPAQAQVGSRVAYQGVTGDAGTRFITQDLTIPSGGTASVHWRHRFQFDNTSFCNGTACGTALFTVDILTTSNLLLANLYTRNVASDQFVDTGWETYQRNLSAFAGLTVRLRFRTTNTANLSGPGQLEIDGVSVQSPGLVPTAADVSVSGRVSTSDGRGIARARVTLIDSEGVTLSAIASPFGYYQFDGVRAGGTYVLIINDKRYRFEDNPRTINLLESLTSVDFVASP